MRVGRAQQPTVEHARQHDVVGVEGAAGDFGVGVDFGARRADDMVGAGLLVPVLLGCHEAPPAGAGLVAVSGLPVMRWEAASTAS